VSDPTLEAIFAGLSEEYLGFLRENKIQVIQVLELLTRKGVLVSAPKGPGEYFLNEHYHIEFEGIPVLCLNTDFSAVLHQFPTVYDASSELGISVESIMRVCRRLQKTTSNLSFRWLDEHAGELPDIEEPMSVEAIKEEYVYQCNRGAGGRKSGDGEVELRRTGRARKPAFDVGIFQYISQSRDTYISVKRHKLNRKIVQFIGRKFKIPQSDDLYVVCDVCTLKEDHYVLYYKYFSLTKFPQTRPIEESDHFFGECDNMIDSRDFAQWLHKDYTVPDEGASTGAEEDESGSAEQSSSGGEDDHSGSDGVSQGYEPKGYKPSGLAAARNRRNKRPTSSTGKLILDLVNVSNASENMFYVLLLTS
jgi:hypothetical protein